MLQSRGAKFLPGLSLTQATGLFLLKNAPQVAATDFLDLGAVANLPTAGAIRINTGSFGGVAMRWGNAAGGGDMGEMGASGAATVYDGGLAGVAFQLRANARGKFVVVNEAAGTASLSSSETLMRFIGGGGDVQVRDSTNATTNLGVTNAGVVTTSGRFTAGGLIQCATGQDIVWGARSRISSNTDSQFTMYDQAGATFNRLNLGGDTAAFPALQRASSTLNARLADDSAYADVVVKDLYTNNAAALVRSNVALTNQAGVAAGTLLNAPTAGDPSKWVAINDNGTVRKIPTWL